MLLHAPHLPPYNRIYRGPISGSFSSSLYTIALCPCSSTGSDSLVGEGYALFEIGGSSSPNVVLLSWESLTCNELWWLHYTCVVSYRLHQLWLYYFLGWFHWATSSNDTVLSSCCLGAGGWSGIPRISRFLPFLSVLSFRFPLGGGGGRDESEQGAKSVSSYLLFSPTEAFWTNPSTCSLVFIWFLSQIPLRSCLFPSEVPSVSKTAWTCLGFSWPHRPAKITEVVALSWQSCGQAGPISCAFPQSHRDLVWHYLRLEGYQLQCSVSTFQQRFLICPFPSHQVCDTFGDGIHLISSSLKQTPASLWRTMHHLQLTQNWSLLP